MVVDYFQNLIEGADRIDLGVHFGADHDKYFVDVID